MVTLALREQAIMKPGSLNNMQRNTIETWMGLVVLLIAGSFLWVAYSVSDFSPAGDLELSAEFSTAGGLKIGDDVRLSGISIGKVVDLSLDTESFTANVRLAIADDVALPSDSSARIASASLLGGNYLEIIPGFETDVLANGDTITDTRDPVNLTDLLGKAVFAGGQ